jgi:hypothetical protein
LCCFENSCGNQRGNSEIKEIQRGTQEIKEEIKWKSTFMQEKLLLLCLLFVLPLLLFCLRKTLVESTNQRGIKNEMKEELKEEILKIKEEFKVELKEELKKSSGINVEIKWNGIQSGNQSAIKWINKSKWNFKLEIKKLQIN